MARFGFAKQHATDRGGFNITNEDPLTFVEQLDKYIDPAHPPKKALSICSGGEIPIYVLLPVCKRVFAVDHGTEALAAAQTKALWLSTWGAKRMQKFIKDNMPTGYSQANSETFKQALQKAYPRISAALRASMKSTTATNFSPFGYEGTMMNRYWVDQFDPERLERARKRLGSLKFIMGDIVLDTAKFGKFDLAYLSNCTEHSGRKFSPGLNHFEPLLAPGALVLYTSSGSIMKVDTAQGIAYAGIQDQSKTLPAMNFYGYSNPKAIKITHDWKVLEEKSGSWTHTIARWGGKPTKWEYAS